MLGFTGMLIALLQVEIFTPGAPWNWPAALAIGLALGALIGAWQGYWVAWRGLPAFVVTLAGLLVFRGGAYLVTDGRTVAPLDATFQRLGGGIDGSLGALASWLVGACALAAVVVLRLRARSERRRHHFAAAPSWVEALHLALWSAAILGFVAVMNAAVQPGTGAARGMPIPVLVLLVVAVTLHVLARSTRFGRAVFALGGNPQAARLAGIDVRRVTLSVFALMGLLAALGAALTTARLAAGANSMGTLSELSVIAAAVIGGTSLAGGVGSVGGAVVGALLMQSLENGMVLLDVSSALRQVAIGLVLIAAVWADSAYQQRRSTR